MAVESNRLASLAVDDLAKSNDWFGPSLSTQTASGPNAGNLDSRFKYAHSLSGGRITFDRTYKPSGDFIFAFSRSWTETGALGGPARGDWSAYYLFNDASIGQAGDPATFLDFSFEMATETGGGFAIPGEPVVLAFRKITVTDGLSVDRVSIFQYRDALALPASNGVPEPGSIALVLLGLVGIGLTGHRALRRRAAAVQAKPAAIARN